MFTGLVEEKAEIIALEPSGDGKKITVRAGLVLEDTRHGDSISLSGVCVTAVDLSDGLFTAEVMAETLRHSTAGGWQPGTVVNAERAAALGDRLGGHIVQGHVDAVEEVLAVSPGERWQVVRISLGPEISPLVVHKGSLTIDGVSLTVSAIGDDWCEVSLIPETLAATTLGTVTVGDPVNVETDMVARHVQRLLAMSQGKEG
jgi:riboflavin synthase